MALFRRKRGSSDDNGGDQAAKKEKGSWRKPASASAIPYSLSAELTPHFRTDTAFKQQRLKAWQPILTPKTVLPTLLIIGFIFAPVGGLLIWGSGLVRALEILRSSLLTLLFSGHRNNTRLHHMREPDRFPVRGPAQLRGFAQLQLPLAHWTHECALRCSSVRIC